jgi:putative transposase
MNRELGAGSALASSRPQVAMSVPRQILPGRFYMLNRRCTQRQFLLRPDDETNRTVLYCLAEAARRFDIDVILPSVMSNHHHLVLFDRHGRIIEFAEHLHKFVAKAMNALRGRWENFWSSEAPCLVHLADRADVMDKLLYAATNPVKDHLVERVRHWPGVNGLAALLQQRSITIRRPRHFFRAEGTMPAEVTLALVIPPELGDADAFRRELRERVEAVERQVTTDRVGAGESVLGRRAVLRQSWRDHPSSREPRRGLRPRVAARSVWSRVECLLRNRAFVIAYREARLRWSVGLPAAFPVGTYWLRRFAGVPISTSSPA